MEKLQKRVNALRNIQLEIDAAESKLTEEIMQLENKHAAVFDALYKKRESIVTGEREPNDQEAKWEYESAANGEQQNGDASGSGSGSSSKDNVDVGKGIPNFWLKVIDSARLTSGIVCEEDRPVLNHLKNIKVKQNTEKPYGFTLEFHFDENEYFTNKVLTKTYEFANEKNKGNPLLSTPNALYKCVGCKIDWKKGKSPYEILKRKGVVDANKEDDMTTGSFFDFFLTHTPDGVRPSFKERTEKDKKEKEKEKEKKNGSGDDKDDDDDDADNEEIEHLFELDYEIGKFIKESLVPKAVLFYTGEMAESAESDQLYDESDDDDDEDDDDDDDNEDDDDESEDDVKPTKKKAKTK